MVGMQIFGLLNIMIILTLTGLSIYALILFIILARKGIKALDLYITKKNNELNHHDNDLS